jgi:hypothetical protein
MEMKKGYKMIMRLQNDERVEVVILADSLPNLVKDIRGMQLTFIPNRQANFKTFTLFTGNIKRIDYEQVEFSPFDNPLFYEVLSF